MALNGFRNRLFFIKQLDTKKDIRMNLLAAPELAVPVARLIPTNSIYLIPDLF